MRRLLRNRHGIPGNPAYRTFSDGRFWYTEREHSGVDGGSRFGQILFAPASIVNAVPVECWP